MIGAAVIVDIVYAGDAQEDAADPNQQVAELVVAPYGAYCSKEEDVMAPQCVSFGGREEDVGVIGVANW